MSAAIGGALNAAPNPFGGFAPFPNSIMIPFMGYQSAVLGYQFGLNYEIGKRTVKAMPNDLFNKIVSGDNSPINVTYNGSEYHMTYAEYIDFITKQHANETLLRFKDELPKAQELMNEIIENSVQIELKKAQRTPSAMAEIINALGGGTATALQDAGLTTEEVDAYTAFIASIYGLPLSIVSAFLNYNPPTTEPTETPLWYEPTNTTTSGNNFDELTSFSLQIQDPIAGFTRSYKTCEMSFEGHVAQYNLLYENPGVASTDCAEQSFSGTAMSHVVPKYRDAINFFYYNNP